MEKDIFAAKIKYIGNIPAQPKREMILSRLGYRKDITELSKEDVRLIDECIHLGKILCKPAGAYTIVPIAAKDEAVITLDNGISFHDEGLAKLLKDSSSVLLMASTVGREVTDRVAAEVEKGNAAYGLILDSVASQTADAVLDWIVQLLNKILPREGKGLTKHRYSPGFGDMPLSYQKDIFEALKLEKLDMALTEKFMLVPEKSVIAIAGIEERIG
jgi:hypothetical protein